ncbi:hypothetical protein PVMG_03640 [Plasmodium vivax Mauritania I]|uniref:Uncharacterized protein n=1 Tax=Plasmodium vivax Mauritania I TaxID=1035515 RepID=A0A0J9T9U4_PLAVI|nr:hypothetical protein PVMG_03640 [Plasmodium vivax Mauritania I]
MPNIEFSETHSNVLYKAYFDIDCHRNSFHNDHCEPDISYDHINKQHIELYKKFERNLKLINYNTENYKSYEENKDKLCFYLKYWFYDQLIVNKFTDAEIAQFLELWNKRKEQKCDNCQCEFNVKKLDEIKILKNVYDYFLFLQAYKDTSGISSKISKKSYCNYVALGNTKRTIYEDSCKLKKIPFCEEFKKYIQKYVKLNENSSILCDEDTSSDVFNYAIRPEQNMKLKEEEEDTDTVLGPQGNEDSEQGDFSLSHSLLPSLTFRTFAISTSHDVFVGPDLHLSQEQNARGTTGLLVPHSSDEGKSTGTIISTSSVGTVGFLFLLYKVNKRIINEYYTVFFQNVYYPDFFNYSNYVSIVYFFLNISLHH